MRDLHQRNRLLQSISAKDRKLFVSDLEQMEVEANDALSGNGRRSQNTCFPTGAVISMLCHSYGKSIEVYGVGREGVIGRNTLRAADEMQLDLTCQIGGSMLYMPCDMFEQHLQRNSGLKRAVGLYSTRVTRFLMQSVACAGLHTIAQRCARWLLVTVDRVDSLEFLLTHELLARMLGVRRSGVSVALNHLQTLQIVRYRLGYLTVLDRRRLERESCECYRAVAPV